MRGLIFLYLQMRALLFHKTNNKSQETKKFRRVTIKLKYFVYICTQRTCKYEETDQERRGDNEPVLG